MCPMHRRALLAMVLLAMLSMIPTAQAGPLDAVGDLPPLVDVHANDGPEVLLNVSTDALRSINLPPVVDTSLECNASPHGVACRICTGPGETELLPVEPDDNGIGVTVGVPNQVGTHIAVDPVWGNAKC